MSSTINSFDKNEIIMDRYEILAEIGSGGFATTYKAMDHSLDIPVAIKAFHKHTGASMDEAVKEAKIAAGLYELEASPLPEISSGIRKLPVSSWITWTAQVSRIMCASMVVSVGTKCLS